MTVRWLVRHKIQRRCLRLLVERTSSRGAHAIQRVVVARLHHDFNGGLKLEPER